MVHSVGNSSLGLWPRPRKVQRDRGGVKERHSSVVNIQGACRKPPLSLCWVGEKRQEDAPVPPPKPPPSKSHDLALSASVERAAILAQKNSS